MVGTLRNEDNAYIWSEDLGPVHFTVDEAKGPKQPGMPPALEIVKFFAKYEWAMLDHSRGYCCFFAETVVPCSVEEKQKTSVDWIRKVDAARLLALDGGSGAHQNEPSRVSLYCPQLPTLIAAYADTDFASPLTLDHLKQSCIQGTLFSVSFQLSTWLIDY